jgi:hypothetical protein
VLGPAVVRVGVDVDDPALRRVLEQMVSGRTKAHELECLLPWSWKTKQLEAAVHA